MAEAAKANGAAGNGAAGNGAAGNGHDVSLLLIPQLSRTFALTIPKLPADLRSTVGVAYLLCRAADTIEDSQVSDPAQKIAQLDAFLRVVEDDSQAEEVSKSLMAALSGQVGPEELSLLHSLPHLFEALSRASIRQQAAVRTCLTKMASGMKAYVDRPYGLNDMAELDDYCYVVAGVVGEMLTELFCDHAAD
ncbi:MAG: squalene/phytoene synthase family protein, partial [Pseudomonadota bacterium]